MSDLHFSKGKFSKFVSSKGFYVALAFCLIGAGTATWVAVDRTMSGVEQSNDQIIQEQADILLDRDDAEEVKKPRTDIPIDESSEESRESLKPSSSSSTAASSSSTSGDASAQSGQQTEREPSPVLAYSLPVRGEIINAFSHGELVKNVTMGDWRTHDGIDIRCEKGSEITAAADGVVIGVGSDPLWGGTVQIKHGDGNVSIYSGLAKELEVKEGDEVKVQQKIGVLEGIPAEVSLGYHLHFAMTRDGKFVDPFEAMGKV